MADFTDFTDFYDLPDLADLPLLFDYASSSRPVRKELGLNFGLT